MPFKSKAQMKWMFANKPGMAAEWASHTADFKNLPNRVKKKSAPGERYKKHQKLRKVDNKMRSFGDFDEKTGVIRINKKMNRKSGRPGELLDTIVHEEYHAKNPRATEKTTRKVTKRIVKTMSKKAKAKAYARYN